MLRECLQRGRGASTSERSSRPRVVKAARSNRSTSHLRQLVLRDPTGKRRYQGGRYDSALFFQVVLYFVFFQQYNIDDVGEGIAEPQSTTCEGVSARLRTQGGGHDEAAYVHPYPMAPCRLRPVFCWASTFRQMRLRVLPTAASAQATSTQLSRHVRLSFRRTAIGIGLRRHILIALVGTRRKKKSAGRFPT